jgi:ectoine hydroxylase-related dioxygenase (phytanoyl-CoA dioxygenase family)
VTLGRDLAEHGWCRIDDVIPEDAVLRLRSELLALVDRQRAEYAAHVARAEAAGHVVGSQGVESCQDVVSAIPEVARHLAAEPVLDLVGAAFGPGHRVTSTSGIVSHPGSPRGRWHADWPYNQRIGSHLPVPYGDAMLHLSAIFMLSEFSATTGATLVVPGSHRCASNPSCPGAEHPADAPHPRERSVTGASGSVVVFDSRLWHCRGAHRGDAPRVALLCRYAPWWLNLEVRRPGSPEQAAIVAAGGRDNSVPLLERRVFARLPHTAKPLFRHWVKE